MDYQDLRKLFHISEDEAAAAYQQRVASKDALKINVSISGFPAFCLMDSEVFRLILQAERLEKEITELVHQLPGRAIQQYFDNCLIDEIVLTNEIEGVNSSRREIGEVLERLENNDRRGRFSGIVEKYVALQKGIEVPLQTCVDIRNVYDQLVLDEVLAQNPKYAPDGELFRAGPVEVYDAAQRAIHHGIEPEESIIEALDVALNLLNDESVETLVRISLFHFLFAYAHPFYDGNGRCNRFISSYILAREFDPLVGLRLSFAIKEQIRKYYRAFTLCEHPLNKGDLTPFVILFSEIVVEALASMRDSLSELKGLLDQAHDLMMDIPGITDGRDAMVKDLLSMASLLIQAALFAEWGIRSKELAMAMEVSVPTVYQRLKFFESQGLMLKRKTGRDTFYAMDLEKLRALAG
ncbi:Fic family protein [Parvibacter caecicola]|uniref:Fic family protein n=1 Tax=Parvibacter caecicola TaxID=747645 RepID=UPI00273208BC|nr:Fic family protein [Parvibacter caecicola]